MSRPTSLDEEREPTLKPQPRRQFELGASAASSAPPTPPAENQTFGQSPVGLDGTSTPTRTKSILNLTSSTLFGIYRDTGYATDREEASTPWGTGAETPVGSRKASIDVLRASIPDAFTNGSKGSAPQRRSTLPRKQPHRVARHGLRGYYLPLLGRTVVLFGAGVLYGLLISHLHDRQEIAPVKVQGIDRFAWPYLAFWGAAGVVLGQALPYVDALWASEEEEDDGAPAEKQRKKRSRGIGTWIDVVRSIGAFVGIAFAIRKLPWQSTFQLSLTLALANPALWYLVDRSPQAFTFSTLVAVAGTAVLLGVNPGLIPPPSPAQAIAHAGKQFAANATAHASLGSEHLVFGVFSKESVGVATWIASVLFVSSICFGNIGRRLVSQKP